VAKAPVERLGRGVRQRTMYVEERGIDYGTRSNGREFRELETT
jgi:hypothetical protein